MDAKSEPYDCHIEGGIGAAGYQSCFFEVILSDGFQFGQVFGSRNEGQQLGSSFSGRPHAGQLHLIAIGCGMFHIIHEQVMWGKIFAQLVREEIIGGSQLGQECGKAAQEQ